MLHGRNPTAYQILNRGFDHWFAASQDAVVGYVEAGSWWVVGGDPVCRGQDLDRYSAEFEQAAAARQRKVCYLGASDDLRQAAGPGHSSITIGADPVCLPAQWADHVAIHGSLRAQLLRAANKGVTASRWNSDRASEEGGLRECLAEWLDARGLPPLHFLVEPDTLGNLADRKVFVAELAGTTVGFLVASPIPARSAWIIEQLVRRPGAPNGTAELLVDCAMGWCASQQVVEVSLGTAPLSDRAGQLDSPAWLRALLAWQRAHARRFYNFKGLEAFKAKFWPDRWDPVFAIANQKSFSPAALWAIVAAYCEGSPLSLVAAGVGSALRQELRWILRR